LDTTACNKQFERNAGLTPQKVHGNLQVHLPQENIRIPALRQAAKRYRQV